jgi:hypothetical protein
MMYPTPPPERRRSAAWICLKRAGKCSCRRCCLPPLPPSAASLRCLLLSRCLPPLPPPLPLPPSAALIHLHGYSFSLLSSSVARLRAVSPRASGPCAVSRVRTTMTCGTNRRVQQPHHPFFAPFSQRRAQFQDMLFTAIGASTQRSRQLQRTPKTPAADFTPLCFFSHLLNLAQATCWSRAAQDTRGRCHSRCAPTCVRAYMPPLSHHALPGSKPVASGRVSRAAPVQGHRDAHRGGTKRCGALPWRKRLAALTRAGATVTSVNGHYKQARDCISDTENAVVSAHRSQIVCSSVGQNAAHPQQLQRERWNQYTVSQAK